MGTVVVLGLGSTFCVDLGSGSVTAPGDRRGSSTAVSSEVKVRAQRARRVHTNTHIRARSPTQHTRSPNPGLEKRDRTPPAPSAPARNPPERARHRPRGPAPP